MVELIFDGPPPTLEGDFTATYNGSAVRISVDDPGRDAARILAGLGADAERLVDVEFMRPSLETVFLSITGRRYDPDEEVGDVVAS